MNGKPLENARSSDLRGSWQALQRAAQRAREVAVQTGTAIVVSKDEKIVRRTAAELLAQSGVAANKVEAV